MASAQEKRLAFARGIFEGKTQREAALAAGYRDCRSLDDTASKIAKHPDVLAKLAELNAAADEKAIVTRDELLRGLSEDYRRDLGPYMLFTETGRYAGLDLKRLKDDGKAHWIDEIESVELNLGTAEAPVPAERVWTKLVSKHAAADRLAKLLGLNAPDQATVRHEYPGIGTKDPAEMSADEIEAERKKLTEEMKRRKG